MEGNVGHTLAAGDEQGLCLSPGFCFHPSDDEIVGIFLMNKVCNRDFT
jgi:hypothetical protein